MNASAKAHADIDTLSLASLASFQDHEVLDENDHGSVAVSVSANVASANRFLRPPLDVPVRPLSPDTLSNLSIDEYRQLHKPFRPVLQVPATTWKGKLQSFWERNLGLLYMLVAQMFGTAMNVTTRTLEVEGNKGKGLHPFQVLFARMSITVVLASAYMAYTKTPDFPWGRRDIRLLLVARGLGGFFGVFGMYYSLLYLPIADATVITFLAPGLACWACSILIKEPFTRIEKIGTFVSFIGVLFIARPTLSLHPDAKKPNADGSGTVSRTSDSTAHLSDASNYADVTPTERTSAVGVALIGVLGAVCAYTTIRWIGKRAHPLISVNYFATWCTIVSIVMQLALPGVGFLLPADLRDWALLLFLGTCGFIMQFLLAAGLSYEKSNRATNITYTSMLFALASDRIFFDTTPELPSIIGSILIMSSAIVMAMTKTSVPLTDDKQHRENQGDDERGLMDDSEIALAQEEMPVQSVQLRALR